MDPKHDQRIANAIYIARMSHYYGLMRRLGVKNIQWDETIGMAR